MVTAAPKILKQFERMERKKSNFLNLLSSLPADKYFQSPDAATWSPGQVGNHLYLSEKLALLYLRKKLSFPEKVPGYHPRSWAGVPLYKAVLASVIKVKAPKNISMWEGQEVMPLHELIQKWNDLRKELFTFVSEEYPHFPHHLVFNHPFAGRLTFRQTLMFFGDHIDHHRRQLKRIIRQIGY